MNQFLQGVQNALWMVFDVVMFPFAIFLGASRRTKVVIVVMAALVSCLVVVRWHGEQQRQKAALQAYHHLMAADPQQLAAQPLQLLVDPVNASQREQTRLSGGQFPLVVNSHGHPVVSLLHFPAVEYWPASVHRWFQPRWRRSRANVVMQGVVVHDPRRASVSETSVSNVNLHREGGHYGTLSMADVGMNGPIYEVVLVPNLVQDQKYVPHTGAVLLHTVQGAVVMSRLLPTGELLVLVGSQSRKSWDDQDSGDVAEPRLEVVVPTGSSLLQTGEDGGSADDDDSAGDDDSGGGDDSARSGTFHGR